jgi:hypothetical protein
MGTPRDCFTSWDVIARRAIAVCEGFHWLIVMKNYIEDWGGAQTHTFAKTANVWGTRLPGDMPTACHARWMWATRPSTMAGR